MPTLIDATLGGASANSFQTLTEAQAYFDLRLNIDVWTAAPSTNQEKALIMAGKRLNGLNWLGSKAATTQAMSWPRAGVPKPDGVAVGGFGGSFGYSWQGYGEEYLSTEIPAGVKEAQCELALYLLTVGTAPGADGRRVSNWSADGTSVSYEYAGLVGGLPKEVMQPLSGLYRGLRLMRA